MEISKQIYFASDFHLGFPNDEESRKRESTILRWLDEIKPSCSELYLLGDIFDFWFEYKWVAPKGFVRLLAKLAEFVDSGIPVNIFSGNHDLWYGDYLTKEIGVTIYTAPIEREYFGKKLLIHHGHALGKYDKGMNFLHKIFSNRFLQWCFKFIPVNWSFGLAHSWSTQNRNAKVFESANYMGDEKEFLLMYANEVLKTKHYDYFVFGHRHVAIDKEVQPGSRYINTGNWITTSTYAILSEQGMEVKSFLGNDLIVH
ncbi:MAG: UDP-2,3-diacylglucosamine diphosphatase [Bacteroidales bacterium]|nr:UDP-2,3-diacylglucosamine diphosphatase [Bacteroidales bacterium]